MKILLLKVLKKLGLLRKLNIHSSTNLNGKKFQIPLLQSVGMHNMLMTELWMTQLLEAVIPMNPGTFIDVGVNIGQTLLKVKSVAPDTVYVGFEPNPICINYVTQLIDVNRLEKVSILPVGISNNTEIGVLHFIHEEGTDSSASMLADFRPDHKITQQQYIPLFEASKLSAIPGFKSASILKIDVEGAELEVLMSMKELIKANSPTIIFEILPAHSPDNTYRISRQREVEKLIVDLDYSLMRILKNKNTLQGLEEITSIEVHSDLNRCDYIMVKRERKDELLAAIG